MMKKKVDDLNSKLNGSEQVHVAEEGAIKTERHRVRKHKNMTRMVIL